MLNLFALKKLRNSSYTVKVNLVKIMSLTHEGLHIVNFVAIETVHELKFVEGDQ